MLREYEKAKNML